ncbi:MAG: aminomethyl-transferring glycine dehydrogenase subunit GcvPB [Peptococcaceae bacterium]|nr:aminomethyl-transferring glycine dehydrogenase subunit GcvPB [Peptococcaceae bacterium]
MTEPLIFELGAPGRTSSFMPECDVPVRETEELIPGNLLRKKPPRLPEAGEQEVARHFTRLSSLNYGVDTGFYPLGSCTMKYNPKVNEYAARLPGFARLHPYQAEDQVQGALRLMYETQRYLAEITGMDEFTLQPAAGAHGEFTGLLMIKAYHDHRGETGRRRVIVPDSSHGTNPATAALCGMEVRQIESGPDGTVDLDALRAALGPDTAAVMLTNPNTLGLFERDILAIAGAVHRAGALLYCDGANMNAVLGISRPGDMGFDAIHLNLHKTFSTPHGGGGPGAGPVGVKSFLAPFLPFPAVRLDPDSGTCFLDYNRPLSIGKVRSFYGNFGVVARAYTYIRALGGEGLREVAENAVINANYLLSLVRGTYRIPFDRRCMHEFVAVPPAGFREGGLHTADIAKRLMDYGYHPPTVYFPLIVEEALMVEPTETESRATLDAFAGALLEIAREGRENPQLLKDAPHGTPVARLDEVTAARRPVLRWQPEGEEG